jgi:hypothetical protein
VQPQLERQRPARHTLVEMQAERPRRLDDPAEPLVDPLRNPLRQRPVGRARRQLRGPTTQAVEEFSSARERELRRIR